jgi:hypothetical protein
MASASSRPPSSPAATLIDPSTKDRFWLVVEDCLIQFHQVDVLGAIQRARSARQTAESTPADIVGDLIYHAEPFYIACDIAGIDDIPEQERLLVKYQSPYESILKKHGW